MEFDRRMAPGGVFDQKPSDTYIVGSSDGSKVTWLAFL
jgi:hypothetical protein